jgi:hypothetical protein
MENVCPLENETVRPATKSTLVMEMTWQFS